MSDATRLKRFDREMMRAMFVSLFAAVIRNKKRAGKFTMRMLADSLGGANKKFEVSRWFNGAPNWTLNTVADLANALDLEIAIEARDRSTGIVFTPQGVKDVVITGAGSRPIVTQRVLPPTFSDWDDIDIDPFEVMSGATRGAATRTEGALDRAA
jgi:hypothetical protein